jgi:uncharacterized protein YwqG
LDFIAQIKSSDQNSLQTFFYCFECSPWGLGDEEAGQWLIRNYHQPSMESYSAIKPATVSDYETAACSCKEKPVSSLPDWDSLESLSPEACDICQQINADEPWEAYDAAVSRLGCVEDYPTLMGGYPKWIQGETSKSCRVCGSEMECFVQLDSEDEADLMWGDCGAVYLFRCCEHKNEFAFELQCF